MWGITITCRDGSRVRFSEQRDGAPQKGEIVHTADARQIIKARIDAYREENRLGGWSPPFFQVTATEIKGGVDLFLDQQAIDTTTPAGKLMFQVTGAFAEFERAMIRQRIHAGLRRAVADGKTLGRPLNDPKALEKARQALGSGLGINKVARQVGLSNSTVARLKAEMLASA
jgi:hypothetical protein